MKRNMWSYCSTVSCILALAAIPFIGFAAGNKSKQMKQETMEQELKASEIEHSEQTFEDAKGRAKYVFCFIGYGMGLPQINAAEIYLAATSGSEIGVNKLSFTQFPAQGLTTTYSSDSFITDSAAAATAIATGYKTNSGVISMNSSKTENLRTIAEMALEKGMKVGIVSSVSIDHATPACFYAHNPSRKNYYEI
jgi:alkaline phosphatase